MVSRMVSRMVSCPTVGNATVRVRNVLLNAALSRAFVDEARGSLFSLSLIAPGRPCARARSSENSRNPFAAGSRAFLRYKAHLTKVDTFSDAEGNVLGI